ncbi:hypothetical protein BH11BAC4_BH11BAC4_10260 [soil metagenome]
MNRLKLISLSLMLICVSTVFSSCEAIAGIFKAGVWTGVILVAAVVGLIIYFISRGKK